MKTLSIIDGSWFMFRARYAFPPLLNAVGQNQNVVYGTLRMLLKLISESADYFERTDKRATDTEYRSTMIWSRRHYCDTHKKISKKFWLNNPGHQFWQRFKTASQWKCRCYWSTQKSHNKNTRFWEGVLISSNFNSRLSRTFRRLCRQYQMSKRNLSKKSFWPHPKISYDWEYLSESWIPLTWSKKQTQRGRKWCHFF